jgi:Ulp1 family protease
MPYMRVSSKKVPVQDNHCDCGLFVLTYLEYFVAGLPEALNKAAVEAANRKKDPWQGVFRGGGGGEGWHGA